jgi:hypothetical protein
MEEISKSKTAEHSWDEDHRIQWKKTEIINKEERESLENKESVFIRITEQASHQSTKPRHVPHGCLYYGIGKLCV